MKGKSRVFGLEAVLIFGLIVCFASVAGAGSLSGAPLLSSDKGPVSAQGLVSAQGTGYYLSYGSFTNCTCDETGFYCDATATYNLPTNVAVYVYTLLNGVFNDYYGFSLGAGSGTYSTNFYDTFAPPLPSSTYEYSFVLRLVNPSNQFVENTLVTISCNNGSPSASSQHTDSCAGHICYLPCAPGLPCPESRCIIYLPGMMSCTDIGQVTYCGCTPPCDPSLCSVFIPFVP
jgi:hypothetical protein